jgi:hypothetical protein
VGVWKGKWDQFQEVSEQVMARVDMRRDVDSMNNWVRTALVGAATKAIPKSSGRRRRKAVPWWTEECGAMLRSRNGAFRVLKRMCNFQHLIQYKQALVRRTICQAKRSCWHRFLEGRHLWGNCGG